MKHETFIARVLPVSVVTLLTLAVEILPGPTNNTTKSVSAMFFYSDQRYR